MFLEELLEVAGERRHQFILAKVVQSMDLLVQLVKESKREKYERLHGRKQ